MTRDQLQRLVDAALCTLEKCEEDGCAKFATWEAWRYGQQSGTRQNWCDVHCPPCTEERGGYCKEGCDGSCLATELNGLMAAAQPNCHDRNEGEKT